MSAKRRLLNLNTFKFNLMGIKMKLLCMREPQPVDSRVLPGYLTVCLIIRCRRWGALVLVWRVLWRSTWGA